MSLLHAGAPLAVLSLEFQEATERRRAQVNALRENTTLSLESDLKEALALIEADFQKAKTNLEIRWLAATMSL